MTTTTFEKSIRCDRETRDYAGYLDDRLIGFFANYHAAEVELDRVARELSIDYCEQGLIDTLPMSADDDPFADPRTDEEKRASVEGWAEFAPCEGYPFGGWEKPHVHPFDDTRTVMVRKPRLFAAPPGFPDDDDDSPDGGGPPRAVTLTSIAIDQAAQRNRICPNCQGPHWGWRCPEIAQRLFAPESAPWHDVALGRELCRMKWQNFRAFVALLLSVPAEHLIIYAASYQAFIRSYKPDSDVTINQVLRAWANDMQRGGDRAPAARQVAA